jgi:4-aminobutyrate aminotransferase/(S)-3-amino-2-methylpropionate transaminase
MKDRQTHVARGPFHTVPVFVARASGAVLEDADGNKLLDFAGGIGVVNTGHCAETVTEAIQAQAEELLHGSFNVTPYENYIRLCERLNRATPGKFAKKTFLANSGAEAVENAIKIARAHTQRQAVVCFDHAFHGRTYMAMSLTSKAKPYKAGFGPYNPEVYRTAYPYAYRWATGSDPERVSEECFQQFYDLVHSRIGEDQTAAVIIEPVLGEGGFVGAPAAFMRKLREFCTAHGIVLIADEIQTGFGRTGRLFACEHLGLEPDLVTSAKGLGGGMPISAVTGRAEIMDAPIEGGIGGTFGGNPVSCAAALAVFDLFESTDVLKRATALGETLTKRLGDWAEKYKVVGEARGLGPMRAIELVRDRATKEPYPELAKKLVKHCYERGVVIMTAGSYGNVIRLLPPLVIEPGQLDEGLAVIESGLAEATRA